MSAASNTSSAKALLFLGFEFVHNLKKNTESAPILNVQFDVLHNTL
jgi:hypothetical protein